MWESSSPTTQDKWRFAVEFIGIDVHKRESQGCILAAEGTGWRSASAPSAAASRSCSADGLEPAFS